MIIPPDPEKDPNIFDAASSTPSLFAPPTEVSESTQEGPETGDGVVVPARARVRNTAFGYPFTHDDLGVGYGGEALPPYRRESAESNRSNLFADPPVHSGGGGAGLGANGGGSGAATPVMRERNQRIITVPGITIPPQPLPNRASTSTPSDGTTPTAGLPFTNTLQSSTAASTSKLWEGSGATGGAASQRNPWLSLPSMTPEWKRWWKKYRQWVYIAIGLLLAGLGVMIGLLVGLKAAADHKDPTAGVPWKDISGDKRQAWVSTGESLNVTYNPQRVSLVFPWIWEELC